MKKIIPRKPHWRLSPSTYHGLRLRGNRYALKQGLTYVAVFNDCFIEVPWYMRNLGKWAKWTDIQQGV